MNLFRVCSRCLLRQKGRPAYSNLLKRSVAGASLSSANFDDALFDQFLGLQPLRLQQNPRRTTPLKVKENSYFDLFALRPYPKVSRQESKEVFQRIRLSIEHGDSKEFDTILSSVLARNYPVSYNKSILRGAIIAILVHSRWEFVPRIIDIIQHGGNSISSKGSCDVINAAVNAAVKPAAQNNQKSNQKRNQQISNSLNSINSKTKLLIELLGAVLNTHFKKSRKFPAALVPALEGLLRLQLQNGETDMALKWIERLRAKSYSPSPNLLFECFSAVKSSKLAQIYKREFYNRMSTLSNPSMDDILCFACISRPKEYYSLLNALAKSIATNHKVTGPVQIKLVTMAAKHHLHAPPESDTAQRVLASANLGTICRTISRLIGTRRINKDALSIAVLGLCRAGLLTNAKLHIQWMRELGYTLDSRYVRDIMTLFPLAAKPEDISGYMVFGPLDTARRLSQFRAQQVQFLTINIRPFVRNVEEYVDYIRALGRMGQSEALLSLDIEWSDLPSNRSGLHVAIIGALIQARSPEHAMSYFGENWKDMNPSCANVTLELILRAALQQSNEIERRSLLLSGFGSILKSGWSVDTRRVSKRLAADNLTISKFIWAEIVAILNSQSLEI